jgi:hypothetical protein
MMGGPDRLGFGPELNERTEMSEIPDESTSRWRQLSGPLRIAIIAAITGMALAIVGIARGNVPLNALSILLALLISGGSWGLVAWAIATAAYDVEADLAEVESEVEQPESSQS